MSSSSAVSQYALSAVSQGPGSFVVTPWSPALLTLAGRTYPSYVTDGEAQAYLVARSDAHPWDYASTTERLRALVDARRWIDRQTWKGAPAVAGQALQWPRTDVPDVDASAPPQAVCDAQCELALMILVDPMGYRSAGDERDRSTKAHRQRSRELRVFPRHVFDLIGCWLAGGSGAGRPAPTMAADTTASPFRGPFGRTDGL